MIAIIAMVIGGHANSANVREVILHSFDGADGYSPLGGLVQGADDALYGISPANFLQGQEVFRIDSSGTFDTPYVMPGSSALVSESPMVVGSDGHLYGVTDGPPNQIPLGMFFTITTSAGVGILASFDLSSGPPTGTPKESTDGSWFGTTCGDYETPGTIYRMSAGGAMSVVYTFKGPDGSCPEGPLAEDSAGYLYGTTMTGGAYGLGTVFRIGPQGDLVTLHSFTGRDGGNPQWGLVQGSDGNLYGTAVGVNSQSAVIFRISVDGLLTVIESIEFKRTAGSSRCWISALTRGSGGVLYGTTGFGGDNSFGSVFSISSEGAYTNLYSFLGNVGGGADGNEPCGGLAQGRDGNLYGTTRAGGTHSSGTVYEIVLPSSSDTLQIVPAQPPIIPNDAVVLRGRVLTRDALTLEVTDYNGRPVPGVIVTLQSNRPVADAVSQPRGPTDSMGIAAASIETRDQTAVSYISSASSTSLTGTPAVVSWFPAEYQSPFLLTCYVISDERDFLRTPIVRSPPGLPGKIFHRGFLDDVMLQGSGSALNGSTIQYSANVRQFRTSACPRTASGDCAVDQSSVAVDRSIVPRSQTATIDIAGIGRRRADDAGGAIKGYHLDLYFGVRRRECANFGRQRGVSVNLVDY